MTTSTLTRTAVTNAPIPGNAGIRARYPIDLAHWIWLPEWEHGSSCFAEFQLEFTLEQEQPVTFDASADQRFILQLDGNEVDRGPDRSELGGWSFHRYQGSLGKGRHLLTAQVWWLSKQEVPFAQVSARPAFALVGLGTDAELLSTGIAAWKVRALTGTSLLPKGKKLHYHVIGSGFCLDGSRQPDPWCVPAVVARGHDNCNGTMSTPWRCEPSPLPEQERALYSGGRIRSVQWDHADRIEQEQEANEWQALTRGDPIHIPGDTELQLLWDFEDYLCGYPRLVVEGGAGSVIDMEWAESLYAAPDCHAHCHKENRGELAGKYWVGFGDRFLHPGGTITYLPLWWRSGRWLRITVKTSVETLAIRDALPLKTTYRFQRNWEFSADQDFGPMLEICERGLRNCVHETFVDCPYYEQMQYVGDTRLQALVWLVSSGDPRPVRRALELFDRSRWVNGFIAERCPTHDVQMSATYSLIQPLMLRDYAWWTADADFVRALLPGTRSALEAALASLDADGLPTQLPGWLFVDWVPRTDWQGGVPGGPHAPTRSPVLLHLPLALAAMAQLEDAYGESIMAQRWRQWGQKIMTALLTHFWNKDRAMIADDVAATSWSEHAQALALDYPDLPRHLQEPLLNALENPSEDMAQASIYFSFHVHEALLKAGRVNPVLQRFEFWQRLKGQGLLTTVEAPEPSRSDCHGWGAHPLYHCLTGLAGIRPSAPGFSSVVIAPQFGTLHHIKAKVPHPKGYIAVDLRRTDTVLSATIDSPVPGHLRFAGETVTFNSGRSTLM